jgi:hypothetical protein
VTTLEGVVEESSYESSNGFLRWWPKVLIGLAVLTIVVGVPRPLQWAGLFTVAAYVHGRWLPWRFRVYDDGLALNFAFGRRLFVPKRNTTVRIQYAGAVALVGRARRFGYPLIDQVLYKPGNTKRLTLALDAAGYDIIA